MCVYECAYATIVHVPLHACVRMPLETCVFVRVVLCVLTEAVGNRDMCLRRNQGEKTSLNVHCSAESNFGICAGAQQISTR